MSWTVAAFSSSHYEQYAMLEEKHGRGHERRCINGKITGCGKCVGFCTYEVHPGFLTEDLKSKHRCDSRECRFFLPKPRKLRDVACSTVYSAK